MDAALLGRHNSTFRHDRIFSSKKIEKIHNFGTSVVHEYRRIRLPFLSFSLIHLLRDQHSKIFNTRRGSRYLGKSLGISRKSNEKPRLRIEIPTLIEISYFKSFRKHGRLGGLYIIIFFLFFFLD